MGRRSFETHSDSMAADSGDITIQALARSSSAAAKIVRKATPLDGLLAYFVLIECTVRSAYKLEAGRTSSMEMPVTSSGGPSRDPPSALIITARARGEACTMPRCIVWTVDPIALPMVGDAKATR